MNSKLYSVPRRLGVRFLRRGGLDEAMRDWVDTTVARIRSVWKVPGRRPRMLELGCGSGPLALRLAAHAETYHATDVSKAAVETLARECSSMGLSHVEFAQREANDFKRTSTAMYDVIVVNSIVQQFPSLDYLIDVLEKASRALRPGGSLFIGNVRSLPLLEMFHTSMELAKAPASRTVAQLKRRIRAAVAAENELVVDPAFFWELGRLLPRLASLVCERVMCQRTRSRDESSQFRYDVVLRHRAVEVPPASADLQEWRTPASTAEETLEGLRRRLGSKQWPILTLMRARDARLASDLRAFELTNTVAEASTVAELRQILTESDAPSEAAIDPDDLFALGEELGYDVDVLARGDAPGYFDARFLRREAPADHGAEREERASFTPPPAAVERPIQDYATEPSRNMRPVSSVQAHMLRRLEVEPESGLYTSFDVVPMPALVNSSALERAWQTLVERHAALRTTLKRAGSGAYMQVVRDQAKIVLEEYDWRHLPPHEIDSELEAYIDSFRIRSFELDEDPPVRLALFRTRARCWLFLGFNHLQLDGASAMILCERWVELYKAYASGGAPADASPSSVRARAEWSPKVDALANEAFWRRELEGLYRPTNLIESIGHRGGDPRGVRSYAKQHMYFERAMSERLAALSREEGLTMSTLVHGAWAILLTEYTDRQDVLFGTTVSRRTPALSGGEDVVGLLDDVLPVRPPQPGGFSSLRAWLHALQDRMAMAAPHGPASPSELRSWSELPEGARLFESYVVVGNAPIDETTAETLDPATPFSLAQLEFPLRVEAWPGPRLLLILQYYRRHFSDAAVAKMLRDLERVVSFMSHGLDSPTRW